VPQTAEEEDRRRAAASGELKLSILIAQNGYALIDVQYKDIPTGAQMGAHRSGYLATPGSALGAWMGVRLHLDGCALGFPEDSYAVSRDRELNLSVPT